MNMQEAEEVPGLRFRHRKVFLETKGFSKVEVNKDTRQCKQDCIAFARQFADALNKAYGHGNQIIIGAPNFRERLEIN